MRVKIFKGVSISSLEEQINDFLETFEYEELIDIKFQDHGEKYTAMVIYEE